MTYRAVHLTSVHYPFDTRIFHRECASLARAGYEVTLIAPNADGDHQVNGVKLRAIGMPHNRIERMTSTALRVYRAALEERADIYHLHDPELLPIGAMLKLRGKRVIYDVHEDFKGTMDGKAWIPWILRKPASIAVHFCESTLGRLCDRVIAATPVIAANFASRRTRLVQNFPWLHELRTPDAVPYEEREPIAAYVGWLDDSRGMREMTRAVEFVSKVLPIRLVLGGRVRGGGKTLFENEADSPLVEYLGFLNRTQVKDLIARARIGMVIILPSDNAINAQPTKMFEYMSGGLPVIASDFPAYRNIVESVGCGLLVDPQDSDEIADAILWMLRNPGEAAEMGRRGQRAVEERYNWEKEAKNLIDAYRELLPTPDTT
jgi:glycosyltransferase involved in cell wall biosynthesis